MRFLERFYSVIYLKPVMAAAVVEAVVAEAEAVLAAAVVCVLAAAVVCVLAAVAVLAEVLEWVAQVVPVA